MGRYIATLYSYKACNTQEFDNVVMRVDLISHENFQFYQITPKKSLLKAFFKRIELLLLLLMNV